jgi:hypothetical protein
MSDTGSTRAFAKPLKVLITQIYTIGQRKRAFVVPSTIHLGGENSPKAIEWVNESGGPVEIWLPALSGYLSSPTGANFSEPFVLENGKTSAPFLVKDKVEWEKAEFFYHYNVYCKSIGDYAQGDSEPGMGCP